MNDSKVPNSETNVRRKLNFMCNISPKHEFVSVSGATQEKRKNNDRIEIANYLQFKAPKRQKIHSIKASVDRTVIY